MKKATLENIESELKKYKDDLQQYEETKRAFLRAESRLKNAKERFALETENSQLKFTKEELENLILSICDMDINKSLIEHEWMNHSDPKGYFRCNSVDEYVERENFFEFLKAMKIVTGLINVDSKLIKSIIAERIGESSEKKKIYDYLYPDLSKDSEKLFNEIMERLGY